MAYEYRVMKDYECPEFCLVEGDIVTDADFYEPDIPGNLVGRGVLQAADMDAENKRLSSNPTLAFVEKRKESKS